MPALLKSKSTRPHLLITLAKAFLTASGSATSTDKGKQDSGEWEEAATSSKGCNRRPIKATRHPSAIKAIAAALPTPVPAPVTIAILEWDMSISPEKNVIGDF
jgi:hypothetical protein